MRDAVSTERDVDPAGRGAVGPVVAVCDDAEAAGDIVHRLIEAGFASTALSVVGTGRHACDIADERDRVGDRLRRWGSVGGICGAIGGLLLAPVLFFVAPLGVVAAVGPFALTLLAALEGALVGAGTSAVVAALTSIGIEDEQALHYEQALGDDALLVILHGTAEELERAGRILRQT